MKSVLVSSVNWLGDVIFSTPVYKAIKEAFPSVRITALAVPRVDEVLKMCPFIDEVIVYDEEGFDRPLINKFAFVQRVRKGRFDAVLFLRPSRSRVFLCALAGIPVRVGVRSKMLPGLLTRQIEDNGDEGLHRSDVYLKVIEGFGIKVHDRKTILNLDVAAKTRAEQFLQGRGIKPGDPYIVLNTGGNWDLKQWPWENFADLSRRIDMELKWKVVLPGSSKDEDRAKRIAERSGSPVAIIAGETDLQLLSGIFSGAKAVVSADSGPLHLANAVGAVTVGIFGPTRPEITGPRGSGRSVIVQTDVGCNRAPCYYLECPDNQCMKQIAVNDVFQAIQKVQG